MKTLAGLFRCEQ